MDAASKVKRLQRERGWSNLDLAGHSKVSVNTIESMHKRNYQPSLPTLISFCKAFGLTLAQFFTESKTISNLTNEQESLLFRWSLLNSKQKTAISTHIDSYIDNLNKKG